MRKYFYQCDKHSESKFNICMLGTLMLFKIGDF
jgi:hypothetical protein